MTEENLAKGLGLFSLGLGLTQLVAPDWLGRQAGLGRETGLMRALGGREIMTGLGVLNPSTTHLALWGRVVGDVMDLAILTAALRSPGSDRKRVAIATGMVAGVTLLDLAAARMTGRDQEQYH
jgi:hypothetical protein